MSRIADNLPKPTESELKLLRILWVIDSGTVRDLHDALNKKRLSGYTTTLKLLQIMTAKGLVIRDEANRAHIYRAAISQDAMQSKILRDISLRLFSGSAAQLAMHALAMEPASEIELNEIRTLIDRKRYSSGVTSPRKERS